ncbi:hypothetical protein JVT61DRAFT_986 [Boletus reticuloceps]|uniref:Fcf2 pre-rRNA processing C-terminal domain-containing protein n=1 Tax=Boletus reticuloceps TaxID=495285 RepID=A0A8I2YT86_9AGAM|nr:hypothetical protein JVT61DRAFT_986 [Boletus reticuloceps]
MSTDSDSEEVITPEYLQSLLDKARQNVREEAQRVKMLREEGEMHAFGEQDIIQIGEGDEAKEEQQQPLPPLDPGVLPPPYFEFGNARHQAPTSVRDPDVAHTEVASSSMSIPAPPEDPNADWKQLTKKAAKGVEALRLRNQLDPKRFYRKDDGEGKGIKGLPKHFAIGTILPTSTPFGTASTDNLPRAHRKRTLVDELVDDAEARRYAKKKFDELQQVRGRKGKKTLHKKNDLRKPKW